MEVWSRWPGPLFYMQQIALLLSTFHLTQLDLQEGFSIFHIYAQACKTIVEEISTIREWLTTDE